MNKFGIQTQRGDPPDYYRMGWTRIAVAKFFGNALNFDMIRTVRMKSPNTLIVLRAPASDWYVDLAWTKEFANLAATILTPFLSAGLCDVVSPPNEPVIKTVDEAKRLNECQVAYADFMHARGFKQVIAYDFSVGNPEPALWPYLLDGLRASEYLGLHEYGNSYAPFRLDSDPLFYALRHRSVWPLLPPAARRKVLITECGVDTRNGGYRSAPFTFVEYVAQLKWWLGELEKDEYVGGCALFGAGMEGKWVSLGFDVLDDEGDREQFWSFEAGLPPVSEKITPALSGAIPPEPAFRFARFPLVGNYPVTQAFGENPAMYAPFGLPGHDGEDEGCQAWTPVYAVADGTVSRSTIGNYGNHITITHIADWQTLYAHLSVFSVSAGQAVQAGDLLGYSGATGNVTGPHLHFGLFRKNHFYTDANGVLWPFNIFDCTPYLDAVRPGAPAPTGATVITPIEISQSVPFLAKRALQVALGQHIYGEVSKRAADGKNYILDVYALAGVGTEEGHYADGEEFYFDPKNGFAISDKPPVVVVPPVVNPPPGGPLPYSFPQALTDIGAVGHEGSPIAGKPFYRINGASTRTSISAFMVMTVIGVGGIPVVGAQVVNLFPDGHGEVVLTDGSGAARFQFGASSSFSNPGGGPFTVFVAEGAVKDDGTKVVTWKFKLSDTIASLGDFGGQHQEIYVQFVKQ